MRVEAEASAKAERCEQEMGVARRPPRTLGWTASRLGMRGGERETNTHTSRDVGGSHTQPTQGDTEAKAVERERKA